MDALEGVPAAITGGARAGPAPVPVEGRIQPRDAGRMGLPTNHGRRPWNSLTQQTNRFSNSLFAQWYASRTRVATAVRSSAQRFFSELSSSRSAEHWIAPSRYSGVAR